MEACIAGARLSRSDKRETHRRVFNREIEVLKKCGLISVRDNLVWRIGKLWWLHATTAGLQQLDT